MVEPHPDLVDYIERQLSLKIPREHIKNDLISIGHDPQLVETCIRHVFAKKRIKTISVVFALILVLTAAVLLGIRQFSPLQKEPVPTTSIVIGSTTTTIMDTTTTTLLDTIPIERLTGTVPGQSVYHNALLPNLWYTVDAEKSGDGFILSPDGYIFYAKPINADELVVSFAGTTCEGSKIEVRDSAETLAEQDAKASSEIVYPIDKPIKVLKVSYRGFCADTHLTINKISVR